jgi:predicted membrane protein
VDVESRRAGIKAGIGYLRMARAVQVVAMAINAFAFWLNVHLHLYAGAGISVTAILALVTLMAVMTRIIRRRRAQLRSLESGLRRPDYGQIADLEQRIFGRTFDHGR